MSDDHDAAEPIDVEYRILNDAEEKAAAEDHLSPWVGYVAVGITIASLIVALGMIVVMGFWIFGKL